MEPQNRFFWALAIALFTMTILFTFFNVIILAVYVSLITVVYIAVSLTVPVKRVIFDFIGAGLIVVWVLVILFYAI